MNIFHTREFGGMQAKSSVAVAVKDVLEVGPIQTTLAPHGGGHYSLRYFIIKTGRGEHSCYPDPFEGREKLTIDSGMIEQLWVSTGESRKRLLELMAAEGEA